MPTWLKVILILFAIFFLGLIALGVGSYYFVKKHGKELVSSTEKMSKEGADAGKGQPAETCVAQSLDRVKKCDGLICEVQVQVFLTSCLGNSNDPETLCATIPKDGIMAKATWTRDECARRGMPNDQACMRIMQAITGGCDNGFRKTTTTDDSTTESSETADTSGTTETSATTTETSN